MHVHSFDHMVLNEEDAEAALNPLALGARALLRGGPEVLESRLAGAGTVDYVVGPLGKYLAEGTSNYILLQLPAGDQTFEEARDCLELFISDVMPQLT